MKIFKSTQYSTQIDSIIKMLDCNTNGTKINVDPLYQRNVVWRNDEQSYFIDSIMKGITPMPILFCQSENDVEKVCMDGKQRLSSLKNYCKHTSRFQIWFSFLPCNLKLGLCALSLLKEKDMKLST